MAEQDLSAQIWTALRVIPSLAPTALQGIHDAFSARLELLPPIAPIPLAALRDQLVEAGVSRYEADEAILFLERTCDKMSRDAEIPGELRALDPAARRRRVDNFAQRFAVEIATQQDRTGDYDEDRTAPINLEQLPLPDPARRFPVVIAIAGRERGRMYHLGGGRLVLGRAEDADISIDDQGISRSHAAFEPRGEEIVVVDLGSRNGILVNGLGVDEHELEDGDRIQVGANTILKFSWADEFEERYQAELHQSATTDPLTGVKHRAAFVEQLRTECSFARRHNLPLSLVAFELRGFAELNRARGHLAGDAILAETGLRVRETLRAEDFVGRLDGDRFAILLRSIEAENAWVVARRVEEIIADRPFQWRSSVIPVQAAAVAAPLILDERDTPQELLAAVLAMLDDVGR